MFSGIIEDVGRVEKIIREKDNLTFLIKSKISKHLKVDQSVSHNGVCLTVTEVVDDSHQVTAIKETLNTTNLSSLMDGETVNLERSLKLGDRIDGHIVQGHVDQVAECVEIKDENGSWLYTFKFHKPVGVGIIQKGSIALNGVSLTICNNKANIFSVAVIPYTHENTNFKEIIVGGIVNVEFDVLGKYVLESEKMNKNS
ncbi:MAG: riboflavin synthase [Flavobacteriales bacterium]|nr:MAG: riboflavin synthase [Flavobacteriales bacterium]